MARLLAVSRSGYYRWQAAEPDRVIRAIADGELATQIAAIHAASGGAYGAPRVVIELRAQGRPVNRKRVERLMRQHRIVGRHLRRRIRTTISDPAASSAPDLLSRDFSATDINQRWCGDITYLRAGSGWLYLATVIDIASRRLIGWSIAGHMRTRLVIDALAAAVAARGGHVDGVVLHTDRGAQYTSAAFEAACRRHGIRPSRGHIGSSYDNALAESFFATLKRELPAAATGWTTEPDARQQLFRWIAFYNHRRRHSAIDYLSPADYESRLPSTTVPSAA